MSQTIESASDHAGSASTKEQLVVRRVSGVDLRATVELLVQRDRQAKIERSEHDLRPAVQAALEDSDRTLVLGAYHEGLPGFAHGKMVGFLSMSVFFSIGHAGEVGWIEELFVRPDYRKKELGSRLLNLALEWARGRGLRTLEVEVGAEHETDAANKLYFQRGFVRVQRARLSLSPL